MLMFVFIRDSYNYICHKFGIIEVKDEYGKTH